MESNIRLILSSATTSGEVRLSGFEQIQIKKIVSDIKDLSKTKSSYAQNFTIPGDPDNNKLLNHIFEIGADSTFDPRLKAKCWITEDSISIMEGALHLTNIKVNDQKKITYEVAVYGETSDLFSEIGDGYIEDLDFSDIDHTLSVSAVTHSWSADTDYFYGLVDYGYDLSLQDINGVNSPSGLTLNKIYPSIRVKNIFDKIIEGTGKVYKSSYLTGSTFANQWIPYNGDASGTQPESFINSQLYKASTTGDTFINYTAYTSSQVIVFNTIYQNEYRVKLPASNDSTGGNFDNGGIYNEDGTYQYTGSNYSVQRFTSAANYKLLNLQPGHPYAPGSGNTPILAGFSWHRSSYGSNGQFPFYESYAVAGQNLGVWGNFLCQTPFLNGAIGSQYGPVQPGERIWCNMLYKANINIQQITGGTGNIINYTNGAYIFNEVLGDMVVNTPVYMNNLAPKKIKKVDFLKSIISMNNLIIEPDKDNTNTLIIEPADIYYASGATKDWTNKLDLSKDVSVQLISNTQPKKTIFSYKADKDYLNEYYTESLNETYGQYIYDNSNEFNKEEKRIEVIFSPTPCDNIRNSDNIVVPKIYKKEANGNYGRTDHNIRILQKSMVNFTDFTGTTTGTTLILQGQNVGNFYPCLNHLDHPFTGTTDLNWGTNDYVYWTLNSITENNLVNRFWKKSLDEYNAKDARIITAYFDLNASDINQFKFNDRIYVKGLTSYGGHYFKVNSIEYSPTSPDTSKVELIKVLDTTVSASTKVIYKKDTVPMSNARNSITLGDSQNQSTGSIVIGSGNFNSSERTFILGNDNKVESSSEGSFVIGSGNTIVGGVIGTAVFGNNISATTSGTVYTTNLVVTSAITVGTTVISGNTLGLWSSSTGSNSIVANNSSINFASGNKTLIGNGFSNSATSNYSTVVNGYLNIASNTYASIVGGQYNSASGTRSFIGCGGNNNAYGTDSVIVGGSNGIAGARASIVGGATNKATGSSSFIGNGSANSATTAYSSVLNGVQNIASGNRYSTIISGRNNQSTNWYSAVLGGAYNYATNGKASIVNGTLNRASGYYSFIGNGKTNSASTTYSTVINGRGNRASGTYSIVGSGRFSYATGAYSFVGNTRANLSLYANTASGTASSVLNGRSNNSIGNYSSVLAGIFNTAYSTSTAVVGGSFNIAKGLSSVVIGGGSNIISGTGLNTVIVGGSNFNATSANTVYMPAIAFQSTGSSLAYIEIPIGDWDMDTTASKNVPHSLTSTQWYTVRGLSVMIWDDLSSKLDDLNGYAGDGGFGVDSTNIYLQRTAGGYFDSTDYNATSFNRGYISFWYNPNV